MDIPSNFKSNKKQGNIKKTSETDSIFSLNSLGEPVDINPEQIKEACAQGGVFVNEVLAVYADAIAADVVTQRFLARRTPVSNFLMNGLVKIPRQQRCLHKYSHQRLRMLARD